MADDPAPPKRSWAAERFDTARDAVPEPPAPEKTRETDNTRHDAKPDLTLEMPGPDGKSVRRDSWQSAQDRLREAKAPKPEPAPNHERKKDDGPSPNMAKFRDANERGR